MPRPNGWSIRVPQWFYFERDTNGAQRCHLVCTLSKGGVSELIKQLSVECDGVIQGKEHLG